MPEGIHLLFTVYPKNIEFMILLSNKFPANPSLLAHWSILISASGPDIIPHFISQ